MTPEVGIRRALLMLAAVCTLALASAASAQDLERRVVGGSTTTIGKWPWQVGLVVPQDAQAGEQNAFERQFCGGSLVARTIVITAAHCMYNPGILETCDPLTSGFRYGPEDQNVIVNRTILSSSAGREMALKEVYYFVRGADGAPQIEAYSDPGQGEQLFDCETFEWDVVFLELQSAAPRQAKPILIAGADERNTWAPGRRAVVTGWGKTSEEGPRSDILRVTDVSIVSDATCGSPDAYGSVFVAETMLCAGVFPEGGRDTCEFDSGGPLVVPVSGGAYRLVGATSFGEGCARPNKPGVYARLADDPIRSALRRGIRFVADVDVVGSGADPRAANAPQTEITKAPKRRTSKRKTRFAFTADEPAVFECRFDRQAFSRCKSPLKRWVKLGKHKFKVRAIDSEGNVDKTPDEYRWRVKRKQAR